MMSYIVGFFFFYNIYTYSSLVLYDTEQWEGKMHFNKTQSSLRGEGIEIKSSQVSTIKALLITSEIGEANTWELSLLFKCVELKVEVETINENSVYFYNWIQELFLWISSSRMQKYSILLPFFYINCYNL